MKKYIWMLLGAALVFLVGCNSIEDAKSSTIYVNPKGKVTSVIVEDFQKEYYDEKELKESINTAIDSYNQQHNSKAVTLKKLTVKKETAKAVLTYDSCDDYCAFNDTILFSGTVAEAQKAGYDFQTNFITAAQKEASSDDIINQHSDAKVIITNEPVYVQTKNAILYVSKNVSVKGGKLVQVPPDDSEDNENAQMIINDLAYVIYQP